MRRHTKPITQPRLAEENVFTFALELFLYVPALIYGGIEDLISRIRDGKSQA